MFDVEFVKPFKGKKIGHSLWQMRSIEKFTNHPFVSMVMECYE